MQQAMDLEMQVIVPEKFVLLEKEEYEDLKKNAEIGNWARIDEISNRLNVSKVWLVTNVLSKPKFKKELDVKNGGFVKFPKTKGSPYLFHKSLTMKWFDENFTRIMQDVD